MFLTSGVVGITCLQTSGQVLAPLEFTDRFKSPAEFSLAGMELPPSRGAPILPCSDWGQPTAANTPEPSFGCC